MKRIDYTFMLTLGASIGACPVLAQQNVSKPNIVLILLDDVGYSDFGCYGSEINTPNIDRLAENGIRLRHFYNQARSAPTRASLITGLYPHQVGNGALGKVPGYPAYQGYPNENNVFLPEALKTAGYFNVMTGKWHLGYFQGVTPISRGFDRSLNAPFGGYYFLLTNH
jgi:arylsulfatase A-like enzyme